MLYQVVGIWSSVSRYFVLADRVVHRIRPFSRHLHATDAGVTRVTWVRDPPATGPGWSATQWTQAWFQGPDGSPRIGTYRPGTTDGAGLELGRKTAVHRFPGPVVGQAPGDRRHERVDIASGRGVPWFRASPGPHQPHLVGPSQGWRASEVELLLQRLRVGHRREHRVDLHWLGDRTSRRPSDLVVGQPPAGRAFAFSALRRHRSSLSIATNWAARYRCLLINWVRWPCPHPAHRFVGMTRPVRCPGPDHGLGAHQAVLGAAHAHDVRIEHLGDLHRGP